MAKFLLAWELGGALGHLSSLRALAEPLLHRGHQVSLALADLTHATKFFPNLSCQQAPQQATTGKPAQHNHIAEPSTFADVLHNAGWFDQQELDGLVQQWRSLLDEVSPDVAICDYAPTAFLALQNHSARAVFFGTGFYNPPDVSPLPDMCPWRDNYPDRLRMTEQRVLEVMNAQLLSQGAKPVERVAQLATRAAADLITTYPEMDHYPGRRDGEYVGPWGELQGEPPNWPHDGSEGTSPKIFAYLKPMESLPHLLHHLRQRKTPTIVYAPEAHELAQKFASERLQVAEKPLAMHLVTDQCNLAILNAGHGATLHMLLAGKPILAIPLSGEQYLVAENVVRIGAGLSAFPNEPRVVLSNLQRLVNESQFAESAQAFSAKYAAIDREDQIQTVVQRLESLAILGH